MHDGAAWQAAAHGPPGATTVRRLEHAAVGGRVERARTRGIDGEVLDRGVAQSRVDRTPAPAAVRCLVDPAVAPGVHRARVRGVDYERKHGATEIRERPVRA